MLDEALLVLMGFLTIGCRLLVGTWLHPSAIVAATWTVIFAAPTLGGLPSSPFVAALITVIVLMQLVTGGVHVGPREARPSRVDVTRGLGLFVIFGSVAGVASAALVLRANGYPLATMYRFSELVAASADVTFLRYTFRLETPVLATALLAPMYGAAVVAPYAATVLRGWRRWLMMLAPTLSGAYYALATTAKAGFLTCIVLTVAGWAVMRSVQGGGRPQLRFRSGLMILVSAAVVTVAFLYFTAQRMGGWTPGNRHRILSNVLIYAGGDVHALQLWLDDPQRDTSLHFGARSFAGFVELLSGDPETGAAYTDVRQFGGLPSTNVYGILRQLVEDFGLYGAMVAMLAGTLVAVYCYRRAVVDRRVVPAQVLAMWLAVNLFGLSTNIFASTSIAVGLTAAAFVAHRCVRFSDPATPVPQAPPRPVKRPGRPTHRDLERATQRRAAQRG